MKIDISNEFYAISDEEIIDFVNNWAIENYGKVLVGDDARILRNRKTDTIVVYYEGAYVEELDTNAQTVSLSKTGSRISDESFDENLLEIDWRKYLNARIPNYLEFFKKSRFNKIGEYVAKERIALEKEISTFAATDQDIERER